MKKVLILCTGNSCRSQIAEGFLKKLAGSQHEIYSAGIEKHGVNPIAIDIMAEKEIDLRKHTSNLVDEYAGIDFDYVLTVCDHAKESCPLLVSKAESLHFNFPDPAKAKGTRDEILAEFRRVRDQISHYCENFNRQYLNENNNEKHA